MYTANTYKQYYYTPSAEQQLSSATFLSSYPYLITVRFTIKLWKKKRKSLQTHIHELQILHIHVWHLNSRVDGITYQDQLSLDPNEFHKTFIVTSARTTVIWIRWLWNLAYLAEIKFGSCMMCYFLAKKYGVCYLALHASRNLGNE